MALSIILLGNMAVLLQGDSVKEHGGALSAHFQLIYFALDYSQEKIHCSRSANETQKLGCFLFGCFLLIILCRTAQKPHRVQGSLEVLCCCWSHRRRKGPTCEIKPVCLSLTGLLDLWLDQ